MKDEKIIIFQLTWPSFPRDLHSDNFSFLQVVFSAGSRYFSFKPIGKGSCIILTEVAISFLLVKDSLLSILDDKVASDSRGMLVDIGVGEDSFDDFLGITCLGCPSSRLAEDDLDVDGFGIGGQSLNRSVLWIAGTAAHLFLNKIMTVSVELIF